mmetsp:Transcript_17504/g.61175  ORF Transcript_17504/g.61175 Transcript_17504/m.61175 type:complete len:346 (+) Transcript_17504:202-1239(+)
MTKTKNHSQLRRAESTHAMHRPQEADVETHAPRLVLLRPSGHRMFGPGGLEGMRLLFRLLGAEAHGLGAPRDFQGALRKQGRVGHLRSRAGVAERPFPGRRLVQRSVGRGRVPAEVVGRVVVSGPRQLLHLAIQRQVDARGCAPGGLRQRVVAGPWEAHGSHARSLSARGLAQAGAGLVAGPVLLPDRVRARAWRLVRIHLVRLVSALHGTKGTTRDVRVDALHPWVVSTRARSSAVFILGPVAGAHAEGRGIPESGGYVVDARIRKVVLRKCVQVQAEVGRWAGGLERVICDVLSWSSVREGRQGQLRARGGARAPRQEARGAPLGHGVAIPRHVVGRRAWRYR